MKTRHKLLLGLAGGGGSGLGPSGNRLAEWWAQSGVYSDTSLTTPAVEAGPVASWADQNGILHLSQASASAPDRRPIFDVVAPALNNKSAIKFSTDDYLGRVLTSPLLANMTSYAIYVVYANCVVSGEAFSESSTTSDVPFLSFRPAIANNTQSSHRGDGNVNAAIAPTSASTGTGPFVVSLLRLAANSFSLRINGVQKGTSSNTPGTTTTNFIAVGALVRTSVALPVIADIAYVGLYNVSTNYTSVENVLATYYGITLP